MVQGKSGGAFGKKRVALRALAVVERLASFSYSPDMASKLVDALLPMLMQKTGPRCVFGTDSSDVPNKCL